MQRKKNILSFLTLLLASIALQAQSQSYPNANSVVEDATTQVVYTSLTDAVCTEKRTVTVLNDKGKEAADFYCPCTDYCTLRKFAGTVTDATGKVIRKIKKTDLLRSEYSAEMASDAHFYSYEYIPLQYPFTITYEWETKYTDGLLGFPVFLPQEGYNQAVVRASYSLLTPANVQCYHHCLNLSAEVKQESTPEGVLLTKVEVNNLPALCNEPSSPMLAEILPRIYFVPEAFSFAKNAGRMDNWQTYGLWQYALLEGRDQLPPQLIETLKEKTAHCQSDYEKVAVVYNYLAETTRYVSIQLGIGGLQPAPASEVYRTGFGDCKALSNYTRAMLAALGIPSVYTVISTNNRRFTPDFASANQANHVILQVPLANDTLWLECTNPKLPLGYVHNTIAGHDALLIKPEGGFLHRLPDYPDSLNTQTNHANIVLASDGSAKINVRQRSRFFQYEDQFALSKIPATKQKEWLRASISLVQAEVAGIRCDEYKGKAPELNVHYTIDSKQYGSQTGKRLFIPVNIFHHNFYGGSASTQRTQEVQLYYGYLDTDSISIRLPEDYAIESMPRTEKTETPFGEFSSSIRVDGEEIRIIHRLFMKRGRYPKEDYEKLLEFKKKTASQYAAKIIIKKKSDDN